VWLEPNPDTAETCLRRMSFLLADLERARRWSDLVIWLARFGGLARTLQGPRPDVAEAISVALTTFYEPDRINRLIALYDSGDEGRATASALVASIGPSIAGALCVGLEAASGHGIARPLAELMRQHAALLAPVLVRQLSACSIRVTIEVVRVLGFAGAGYEDVIGGHLTDDDEQVVLEALRALARIGTAPAAAAVARHVRNGAARTRTVAEETLWRFDPVYAQAQALELLGRREFVLDNPDAASRLLERAGRRQNVGFEPVLSALVPLRFRFWNPALMRVGLKARSRLLQ
jgi:hypothetical protein